MSIMQFTDKRNGRTVRFPWDSEQFPTEQELDNIFLKAEQGVAVKEEQFDPLLQAEREYLTGQTGITPSELRQVEAESLLAPEEQPERPELDTSPTGLILKYQDLKKTGLKGVASFFVSLPQTIGGLTKEFGERMEEQPAFWDRLLAVPTGVNPILKGIGRQIAKRTQADEKIVSLSDKLIEKNREFIKKSDWLKPPNDKVGRLLYDLGSGGASLLTALGVSYLTKSPTAAAGLFGAIAKSETYQRAREAGKSPQYAGRLSTARGVGEAALEWFALNKIFGRYAGKIIPSMITEGAQEMSQEVWGNVLTKYGIDESQKILENVGRAGFLGFALGGGAGVVTGAMLNTESGRALYESGVNVDKVIGRMQEVASEELRRLAEDESGFALIPEVPGKKPAGIPPTPLEQFAHKMPDIDNPDKLAEWSKIADRQIYTEAFSDKCLAGTGFPKMEEGGTEQKLDYIKSLMPDILADKAKERGLELVDYKFVELPEATNLYGAIVGEFREAPTAPKVEKPAEVPVKPEVITEPKPALDISEKEGYNITEGGSNYYALSEAQRKTIHREGKASKFVSSSPLKVKFKKQGYFKFPREKISSPADVAFAFQELKHLPTESLHVVGVKNDIPISIEPISVGTLTGAPVDIFDALQLLKAKKADGYWLVHHHPGADVSPSSDDHRITTKYRENLERHKLNFKGHVVVNFAKFGFIPPQGATETRPVIQYPTTAKKVPQYRKYIQWVRNVEGEPKLTSPEGLADFAKGLKTDWVNNSLAVYLNQAGRVMGVELLRQGAITSKSLAETAVSLRANRILLVNGGNPKRIGQLQYELKDYPISLEDSVNFKDKDTFVSLKAEGLIKEKPAAFIKEEEAEYEAEPEEEALSEMEESARKELAEELEKDPSSNLYLAIKQEGGIRFYRGGVEQEEMRGTPAFLFKREGQAPDELLQSLKQYGWQFESTDEMFNAIRHIAEEKGISIVSGKAKVSFRPVAIRSHLRALRIAKNPKLKTILADVKRLGRRLEKPLPKAKVKGVIRKVIGLEKEKITLRKEEVLARQIKAEARVAREITKELRAESKDQINSILQALRDKEADENLIRRAATDYVREYLPAKERGKLIASIRDAKDRRTLAKLVLQADNLARKTKRRNLVNALKGEIKRGYQVLKIRKKGKGKISPEHQEKLQSYLDSIATFGEKKAETIAKVLQWHDNHPFEAMPAKIQIRMRILQKKLISEMSNDEIKEATSETKDLIARGRLAKEAKLESKEVEFERKKVALFKSIKAKARRAITLEEIRNLTPSERKKARPNRLWYALDRATAFLHRPAHITEGLDGYKPVGDAHRIFTVPIDKAHEVENRIMSNATDRLSEIFIPLRKNINDILNKQEEVMGTKLTREEMYAIYANSKNPDNLATLTAKWGYGWSEDKVMAVIRKIPSQERRMIDKVMDLIGEPYSETVRITKELYGYSPVKVEGYWPIVGDKELSQRILLQEAERNLFKDVFEKASIERGFTIERVGRSGPPNLKFFTVLGKHLRAVIHFNTHALPVAEIQGLIHDPIMKQVITKARGEGDYRALKKWIADVASPKQIPVNWADEQVGRLRRTGTAVMLGIKFTVAMKQVGSLSQTINRVGVRDTTAGVMQFLRNPRRVHQAINDTSVFMRFRRKHFDLELGEFVGRHDVVQKIIKGDRNFRDFLFYMIQGMDMAATYPSWLAAYRHACKLDVADPTRYADDVVRKTQPISAVKDLPQIMKGPHFQKALVMFYTHFSNAYNEMATTTGKLKLRMYEAPGKLGKIKEVPVAFGDFCRSYFWLLIIPALYALLISKPKRFVRALKERDRESLKLFAKAIAEYGTGTLPIIRDIASAMLLKGVGYSATPLEDFPESIIKLASAKTPRARIKGAIHTVGYATGIPASQIFVTVAGAIDLLEGTTDNPLALFVSRWTLGDKPQKAETEKTLHELLEKESPRKRKRAKSRAEKELMEMFE